MNIAQHHIHSSFKRAQDQYFVLAKAQALAEWAHDGKYDASNYPYIEHPRRVVENLYRICRPPSAEQVMVAWLHDVLKNTPVIVQDLYGLGCSEHVVASILLLTKTDTQTPYDQRIQKIIDSGNEDAMRVKLCAIIDNLHPERHAHMRALDPEQSDRLYKQYSHALIRLCGALELDQVQIRNCIANSTVRQPICHPGRY